MIIKHAQSRDRDIEELTALLALPHVGSATKRKIESEIRKIRAGMAGEKEAAYNIDFYYGEHRDNWAVIHDLRVEYQGSTAQIDHLLINRFLEIYLCESKQFGEGVAVNEHGEFSAFYQGRPYGIPSPIEQNERHRLLLKRMFDDGEIEVPTRLGLRMKPNFYSLILVGNSARIIRPNNGKNVKHLDRIIKNEQVRKRILRDIDEVSIAGTLAVAKLISCETLRDFAEYLASFHCPPRYNWKARFGITDPAPQPAAPAQPQHQSPGQQTAHQQTPPPAAAPACAPQPDPAPAPPPAQAAAEPRPRLFCADCKKTVTETVARFCWNNKNRFHGKLYCFNCQKNHPQPK
ncbi:nuclease-related domain-containing protein [Neisseria bacilliformis]|uniref:nuclease-related domain-containing protein n=1 Tax=Neisseria bacilliformis TaxID=267212 RepID=UPI003C77F0C1